MPFAVAKKHIATRTCLGCRSKKAKSSLMRIVTIDGVDKIDINHIIQSRGRYYCNEECRIPQKKKKGKNNE